MPATTSSRHHFVAAIRRVAAVGLASAPLCLSQVQSLHLAGVSCHQFCQAMRAMVPKIACAPVLWVLDQHWPLPSVPFGESLAPHKHLILLLHQTKKCGYGIRTIFALTTQAYTIPLIRARTVYIYIYISGLNTRDEMKLKNFN